MALLSEAARPSTLEMIASHGRNKNEFARMNNGTCQLSLDQLIASFGHPSLTSIDLLSQ
jgi:hypothetical protein